MNCKKCGKKIEGTVIICPNCRKIQYLFWIVIFGLIVGTILGLIEVKIINVGEKSQYVWRGVQIVMLVAWLGSFLHQSSKKKLSPNISKTNKDPSNDIDKSEKSSK